MAGTSNMDRSYMDVSAADYTKYTDESAWEESFEVDQKMDTLLHFNKCLLEGFNNFSNKDIPSLIVSYQNALDILEKGKSPNHFDNMITIKSNLGIAHYFNNEIDKAILYNEDALKMIVNSGRSIDRQLETVQSLYIKILCNLIVFKMVKKEDQECQEIARKLVGFLNSLQDQKKKRLFIKETIYILFRLESLSDINTKYVETMKENVKGANQGCFLLMVGIYCSSKGDNQNALNYYTQSFEVFDTLNDELFMLLTTRLICNCYDQMKVRSKTRNDYEEAYEMLLKEPIFKDINVDILFENFDRRLELARTITQGLENIESTFREDQFKSAAGTGNAGGHEMTALERVSHENNQIWKQAVRLALCRSIVSAKLIIRNDKEISSQKKEQLLTSIGQINSILNLFQGEYNPIILEKLMKDSYTKEAVNNLRLKAAKIERGVRKCFFMPGWTTLKKMVRFQKRKSFLVESQLAYKCYQLIKNGEVLEKYHLSSKGHKKQFFKIIDAKQLRWCDNEKDINKLSACKVYELSQIKGLVFGKVTETFRKKANAGLEPWLCFSLMMDKRSFDLYCTEDNVNRWYIGLGYAIKRHNPNAYCLSVGKFLWRKLKFVMSYLVLDSMSADQKKNVKKDLSFVKLILQFKKLKFSD